MALGVALKADKVEFYKDVPGIFSEDPKKNPDAVQLKQLQYGEALAIVEKGAKVLHDRCIHLAQKNGLPLHVRSFLNQEAGTMIADASVAGRPHGFIYEDALDPVPC